MCTECGYPLCEDCGLCHEYNLGDGKPCPNFKNCTDSNNAEEDKE